jgi:hypothetical protein
VSTSSVIVSHTSTCFATRIVSAGVTKTMATAMNAPKKAQRPIVTNRRAPERATALRQPGVMRIALDRRLVGIETGLELLVHRFLRFAMQRLGDRADVGLLAGFRHRVADDVRDSLFGRCPTRRRVPDRSVRAARGRTGSGSHD